MTITTDVKGVARQQGPVQSHDGAKLPIRTTRDGIAFTASWKESLLLEGRCFSAPFAAMGATDIVALDGAGDLDRPDFCISIPQGYSLIPLKIVMSQQADLDTAVDDAFAIIMVDVAAAMDVSTSTVVSVTPMPCITGSPLTSVCTVFEASTTANITAPTATAITLDCMQKQSGHPSGVCEVRLHYEPEVPFIIDGPAAIYGWCTAAKTPKWAGYAVWAEVPESRYAP